MTRSVTRAQAPTGTEREHAEAMAAWREVYAEQQAARQRLTERHGSEMEKQWAADPNGPEVDAVSLIPAFLCKANPHPVDAVAAPELEPADARAVGHMIAVARRDARQREFTTMRRALAHGATWDDLAHALETTVDDLHRWVRSAGHDPRPVEREMTRNERGHCRNASSVLGGQYRTCSGHLVVTDTWPRLIARFRYQDL